MKNIKLLIMIFMVAVTAVPSFAESNVHALLIGIGVYNDSKIRTLEQQPVRDVDSIKRFIMTNFVGKKIIHTLTDKQATKKAIIRAFEKLAKEVSAGDLLVFYYSGHGSQVPNTNPGEDFEEDGLDEVLVNVDAYLQGGILHNVVTDDELDKVLKVIEAKGAYVKVIVDSCHSGTITKAALSSQINDHYQKRRSEANVILTSNAQRTVWTAAAAGQVSFSDMGLTNSIYTTLLIEAIDEKLADKKRYGGNGDGVISNGELHSYLLETSGKYCTIQEKCEKGLVPTLEIYANYRSQPFLAIPDIKPLKLKNSEDAHTMLEGSFAHGFTENLTKDIHLAIKHQSKKLHLGDEIYVELKSKVKGNLILLDVNAKGELVQIFPNSESKDNMILPGKKYYFPTNAQQQYGFFASKKGKSRLYAIITQDPVDLTEVLKKDLIMTKIENPVHYAGALANKLNAPWTGDKVSRLSRYSVSAIDYTVH